MNTDLPSSDKNKNHFFSSKFSIKGKRNLSLFCSKSLIYDYISKNLDPERTESMERSLKESEELQKEVSQTRLGIQYADCLSKTNVGPEVFEKIKIPDSYFEVLLQKTQFENWPQGLKWGLEAIFVSLTITIIAIVIPWERALKLNFKAEKSSMIIAEITKDSKNQTSTESSKEIKLADQENLFQDEGIVKSVPTVPLVQQETKIAKVELKTPQPTPPLEPIKAPPVMNPPPANVKVVDNTKSPSSVKVEDSSLAKKPIAVAATPVTTTPAQAKAVNTVAVAESPKKSGQGFLYRGTLNASNAVVITPKLIAKMDAMGARKAGEVSLGWKKGDSFYFHFTIPESKFAELEKVMGEYGVLALSKEKHPRVMPDGIVRMIILVNEAHK